MWMRRAASGLVGASIPAARMQPLWSLREAALKPFKLRVSPRLVQRPVSTGAGSGGGGGASERAQTLFGRAGTALSLTGEEPRTDLAIKVGGFAVAVIGLGIVILRGYRESDIGRARMEADAILAARVPSPQADEVHEYVSRLELEAALQAYLQQPSSKAGAYLVVYGARGAGKSTLVEHVLSRSGAGIVVVKTGDAQSTDLDTLVVDTALMQRRVAQPGTYVPPEALKGQLYARLAQATQAHRVAHPHEPHWRPTVVFDIDKSGGSELIASVCAHAKQLAHDKGLCHAIIVLSSSFAVAEMPADSGRQKFLRVGTFSREEASAVLDVTLAPMPKEVASDAAVAAVKARVLPLTTLAKLIGELGAELRGSTSEADLRARVEAWASAFEATARKDVNSALEVVIRVDDGIVKDRAVPMRNLMRDLLDAGAPVELPTAKYRVPAELFASKIRETNASKVTFDVDLVSRAVDFASGAHRKAAAEAEAACAQAGSGGGARGGSRGRARKTCSVEVVELTKFEQSYSISV
jgi:energy-coupling factor transporter ATP-binding protein EcfA2